MFSALGLRFGSVGERERESASERSNKDIETEKEKRKERKKREESYRHCENRIIVGLLQMIHR